LGNNVIIVQGNGIVITIWIHKKLGTKTRMPQSPYFLWFDGKVNRWKGKYDLWDITKFFFN
jgi:hypothetical protein